MTYKNHSVYEGNFVDGKFHGKGKITYPDGDMYQGNFENGYGIGKMTYTDGNTYEENFVGDKLHKHGNSYIMLSYPENLSSTGVQGFKIVLKQLKTEGKIETDGQIKTDKEKTEKEINRLLTKVLEGKEEFDLRTLNDLTLTNNNNYQKNSKIFYNNEHNNVYIGKSSLNQKTDLG